MRHHRFYPSRQGNELRWLANFRDKLPGYAAVLGLTAAQVAAALADCAWLEYLLTVWLPAERAFDQACTEALLTARAGTGAGAMSLPTFNPPGPPSGVSAVAPGAQERILALVQALKRSGKCTETIALDLCIVGSATTGPDLTTLMPVLKAMVSGNAVHLKWGWQGKRVWLSTCEVQVDRGDGKAFGVLTMATRPGCVDKHPFPAERTLWSYKAVYRANDARVGQWSQTVSVAVGG
jgi:hypothetical protein